MKLPTWLHDRLIEWAWRSYSARVPNYTVGNEADPYLKRWYVIKPNWLFSVYVHQILHDDAGRDLHDHRSLTLSILLVGSYWERVPADWSAWKMGFSRETRLIRREQGDIVARSPFRPHRLELATPSALSIFITFPTIRIWGFWMGTGWVPYRQHPSFADKKGKAP